ncbi:hypothetical protein SAMN05216371_8179 [Streptomyces sp. TLI_053]|uniref:hypothetical protein n=1 Tax=Streptomyces sp. TLI_053 TaxID=1855352 RepID=UPI00087A965E|nr:hypothetical protein [Streptomyces sp. TLI_053]SDT83358.1 hypothetical protein SAMN05216371_8179 [Streptomyces sp. TLI_053]
MNLDDLEWQWGHNGGVPPRVVDLLLEHGCLDLLVQAAHERADWSCAQGAVRVLRAAGEWGRAWAVVEPFADTGWQPAVRLGADVLLGWGRNAQALELARPKSQDANGPDQWRDYAEVLVGAGQVDEAIDLLAPRLHEKWARWALVSATDGHGRDERVLDLLGPIAERFRRDPQQPEVRSLEDALSAQVRVLERSGRVDAAIRLAADDAAEQRGWSTTGDWAKLLARHGRLEELRELAATQKSSAALLYTRALENLGRTDEAEAHLRRLVATETYPDHYNNALLELLVRQHRFDDAVEAVARTFDGLHQSNLLQGTMILLAEQGQHDRALALTEGRSPEFLAENDRCWLRSNRWWLMGESGRSRQALAELEALPPHQVDDREITVAWLLAHDGRPDEAIARLRPLLPARAAAIDLAVLLVGQGRYVEAIAVIPGVAAQRQEQERFRAEARKLRQRADGSGGCGDSGEGAEDPRF